MHQFWYVIFEASFWATIAVVAFAFSYTFDGVIPEYRYGATGWPRALVFSIALFASIQTIWSLLQLHRKGTIGQSEEQYVDLASKATGTIVHLKRLANFSLPFLYLFLMPRMGFYILTPFFIAGYMMLLGEKRLLTVIGMTLLFYSLAIIIFVKLLFVPFPVGNWSGFYDISTYFVSILK